MDEVIQKQQEKDVENGIVQREYVSVKGAFLGEDTDVEFEFKGDEEACDEAVEDLRNILENSNSEDTAGPQSDAPVPADSKGESSE